MLPARQLRVKPTRRRVALAAAVRGQRGTAGIDVSSALAAGIYRVAPIDYWQANGGMTYQDPDGQEVVFASWIYRTPRS